MAAPHTEAAIHAAGIEFDGYPSFVARVAGLPPGDGILMLCFEYQGREVRIAHVTLHSSVKNSLAMITPERVLRTIKAALETARREGVVVEGPRRHPDPARGLRRLRRHAARPGACSGEAITRLVGRR